MYVSAPGTPTNAATMKDLKFPGRFQASRVSSGSTKFTDIKEYPLSTTALVSFDTQGSNLRRRHPAEVFPDSRSQSSIRTRTTSERTTSGLQASFQERTRPRATIRMSRSGHGPNRRIANRGFKSSARGGAPCSVDAKIRGPYQYAKRMKSDGGRIVLKLPRPLQPAPRLSLRVSRSQLECISRHNAEGPRGPVVEG